MAESIAQSIVHPHGALAQRSFTMTSSFYQPIEIFVVFISLLLIYPRKPRNFALCENFPLYGTVLILILHMQIK